MLLTLVGFQRVVLGDDQEIVGAADCGLPEWERNEALGPPDGVEFVKEGLEVAPVRHLHLCVNLVAIHRAPPSRRRQRRGSRGP
jgi:hypothetical protein